MRKKQKSINYKFSYLSYVLIVAIAAVFGAGGYILGLLSNDTYKDPSGNRWGYVSARSAKEQVNNFYRQYIEDGNKPELRPLLIRGYGSNNLNFYNSYYKHGFDPITCSSLKTTAFTVTNATSGTVATVDVNLEYSDQSISTLKTSVLINNDGLKIDSIKCSGDKGSLLP